ncbi:MAG: hypothetical protein ISS02_01745 [Candidatus Portnoybacteria bacterium]|nr:hypothetical protein [Candidatus Portnoybacteria bacterium]
MKKLFVVGLLACGLLFVNSAYAGLPVSIKSDLTRIVIPVKHNDGNLFDLVMKDGIAWWINDIGFFTYQALKKVWQEKNLKLQKPNYDTSCFPGGLNKGLFMVSWDKKTKEGITIPVMFNFLGVGMPDGKGGFWHSGEVWMSQNPDQWLIDGKPIYWQPQPND